MWVALSLAPLPAFARTLGLNKDFTFQHDFVLGTSLDLTVTGSTAAEAEAAEAAVLAEVERLRKILDTRDAGSEIRRVGLTGPRSADLARVLEAYRHWGERTGGVIRADWNGSPNLDGLGKAYIVDRAAEAARAAAPSARGIVLDIGGDIRVFGQAELGIADPGRPHDNADPMTVVRIADRALTSSGTYARGRHIQDGRTGLAADGALAASVTAADCLSANALSMALCVLPAQEGLQLLEETRGAEGLLVTRSGGVLRSSGFRAFEHGRISRVNYAGWASGSQVSISLTLVDPAGGSGAPQGGEFGGGGGGFGGRGGPGGGFGGRGGGGFGRMRRPYVAVWAEDSSGKVVKNIALWASKPRWLPELHTWWSKNGSAAQRISQMARATRAAGQYTLSWNGMTDNGDPVPAGVYRIWIETNREHGTHYQDSVTIDCSGKSASVVGKATPEFEGLKVDFGPATGAV
jgi:FAD:protein FMN transferase